MSTGHLSIISMVAYQPHPASLSSWRELPHLPQQPHNEIDRYIHAKTHYIAKDIASVLKITSQKLHLSKHSSGMLYLD
jgi:hypothetical protein